MPVLDAAVDATTKSEATRWTETTRLLCAAAYTNGTFAQEVVEEILEEEHRAVDIPPGVDAGPVIRHCLAALGQKTLRDRILAADVLATVVLTLVTRSGLFLVLGFLLAWGTVAYDLWSATFRVVTKRLNKSTFDPDEAPPVANAEHARRAEELAERQAGNVTVYSGFLPFAGSGFDLGGWSFVIDLRKGKDHGGTRLPPRPVEPMDLYAGVERELGALGMSNLTIEDRAFVNGTDVRGDPALLASPTDRPASSVDDAAMQQFVIAPTHRVRHYKCIRVIDWRGELVLSLFLRFGVANGRLFCELSRFLLAPLKPEMHLSDGMPSEPEFEDVVSLVGKSLAATPALSLRSLSVVMRPFRGHRESAKLLKRIKRDAFFDYGAATTVLDRARSSNYSRYFQLLDKQMYDKMLERTILDAIIDVLDMHNVDTEELVERRSTIINNGIMVPGGTVTAENIAVGASARIANRLTPAKPAATGGGGSASGQPSG